MHDRYLPAILMSSLPILFKRTVSAPIVLRCEQRQLAAGVLSAKCFDAYCTKCHGADDIDTSPARSSRGGGTSDRMKIDDAEGYIPPAPPDTPVAVSRVANVVAALAVVALVFLIVAFCVMADISISTTGAEEAGQGSSTRLANLEKDW